MSENASAARRETFFTCVAPTAERVFLAGTFNSWDPSATPMLWDSSGAWALFLDLAPGTYEYKFVVDGEWCCTPGDDERGASGLDCVPNPFGTLNRVVTVE
jgi:5'-AMP-activated protein kinase regulatory beta subunit